MTAPGTRNAVIALLERLAIGVASNFLYEKLQRLLGAL